MKNATLSALHYIPQSLQILHIEHVQISSLEGLPDNLPNLKTLIIKHCPLKSLRGLPKALPNLRELEIEHTELRSLDGIPQMPQLEKILINHGKIPNFEGIVDLKKFSPKAFVSIRDQAFCSPHGYPLNEIRRALFYIEHNRLSNPNAIPSSYKQYLNEKQYKQDEIFKFFKPSPSRLASRYNDAENISQFEQDRIVYEGTLDTLKFLIEQVGPEDVLVKKLAQQLDVQLKQGELYL
jgi:hypothetical protein